MAEAAAKHIRVKGRFAVSLFNRMMACIGIGSAKVDTLLERTSYCPGEEIRGVVRIQGGQIDQQIDGIDLSVMTRYMREMNDNKVQQNAELYRVRVAPPITVRANETLEMPFAFALPANTPLSIGRSPVWIHTAADIRSAVDPTDHDRIEVVPSPAMHAVMGAFERMGFRLREAETIYAPKLGQSFPFVQEFEWVPHSGQFRGRLDEVELVFLRNYGTSLELLLQVDRRATSLFGLFAEAMDMDESFVRVNLSESDLRQGPDHVAGLLHNSIARYA